MSTAPKTLLEMSGADLTPAKLNDACLVLIDMQNEYLEGPVAVTGATTATSQAVKLLAAARNAEASVIHVVHAGAAGSLFDLGQYRGQIISELQPVEGEATVQKTLPNAFEGTELESLLEKSGRTKIIMVGFMTHMCVSSTARVALDLGFSVTIDANACATRDLPDGVGGVIYAETLHLTALAELADRFAIIARAPEWWK